MKITEEVAGRNKIIYLEGRLDTLTAPELEEYLDNTNIKSCECLIFDMEKLEYISSAGLRVLLTLQKFMQQQGEMQLRNVNEVNMEVFEITGFVDILTII